MSDYDTTAEDPATEREDELASAAVRYLHHQLELPLLQPDGSPTFFYRPKAALEFTVQSRQLAAAVVAVRLRSSDELAPQSKAGPAVRRVKRPSLCWLTVTSAMLRITTGWGGVHCETEIPLVWSRRLQSLGSITLQMSYPMLRQAMNLLVPADGDAFARFPIDTQRHRELNHFAYSEEGFLELVMGKGTRINFPVEPLLEPRPALASVVQASDRARPDLENLRYALRTVKVAAKSGGAPRESLISVHANSAIAMHSGLAACVEADNLTSEPFCIAVTEANVLQSVLRRMGAGALNLATNDAALDDQVLRVSFPYEQLDKPDTKVFDVPADATNACRLYQSNLLYALAAIGVVSEQRPKQFTYALIGDVGLAARHGQLQWALDFMDEIALRWLLKTTGPMLLVAANTGRAKSFSKIPVTALGELLPPDALVMGKASLTELGKVSTVLKNGIQDVFFCPQRLLIRDRLIRSVAHFVIPSKRL